MIMGDKIYERILKNSKDGFLKIKGYKNKNGENSIYCYSICTDDELQQLLKE